MKKIQQITLTGPVGDQNFNIRLVSDIPPGSVNVTIDSGGGCAMTSFAIYRQLIEHPGRVTTEIIRAGSAAVLVALAGSRRLMHGGGHFFLHRCWSATIGTAEEMSKAADLMNGWDTAAADIYAERTGLSLERILELTEAETTIGAEQSLELGFVHEILGEPEVLAYPGFNRQRSELACLDFEEILRSPAMRNQCSAAEPVARRHPAIAATLDASRKQRPKIKPGEEAKALDAFVENERREKDIHKTIETRLRRTIRQGGHMTWPAAMSWTCQNCNKVNFGPPAKSRLAIPCANCAKTTTEITI